MKLAEMFGPMGGDQRSMRGSRGSSNNREVLVARNEDNIEIMWYGVDEAEAAAEDWFDNNWE